MLRSTSSGSPHTGRKTSTDGYTVGRHESTSRRCSSKSNLRLSPSVSSGRARNSAASRTKGLYTQNQWYWSIIRIWLNSSSGKLATENSVRIQALRRTYRNFSSSRGGTGSTGPPAGRGSDPGVRAVFGAAGVAGLASGGRTRSMAVRLACGSPVFAAPGACGVPARSGLAGRAGGRVTLTSAWLACAAGAPRVAAGVQVGDGVHVGVAGRVPGPAGVSGIAGATEPIRRLAQARPADRKRQGLGCGTGSRTGHSHPTRASRLGASRLHHFRPSR